MSPAFNGRMNGLRTAGDHGLRLHAFARPHPEFCAALGDHDIVVGSRYMQAGSLKTWNPWRKMLTRIGHLLTTTLLQMPYDATGAFRLYRLETIPAGVFALVSSQSYSFFFESLYVLWINGYKVKEIPLELPARTYGHSKMALKDIKRSVELLVQLFFRTQTNRKSLIFEKDRARSVGRSS